LLLGRLPIPTFLRLPITNQRLLHQQL